MSGRSRCTPGRDGFGASLNLGRAEGFAHDSTVGKIEKLAGSCTVTRANGIFVLANVGDFVFCGDIIETAEDGCVGIRFVDGTAFHLSSNARMRLKEFSRDSGAPSASFDISRGRFAFIAGEIAKAGRFAIDTPFGSIQGRARSSGIGTLSLAALFLAAMEEAQASSNVDGLLSNGILSLNNANESDQLNSFLSYGDGDKLHGFLSYGKIPYAGFFELTLHGPNPRQIVVDDPNVTVVIHHGSSEVEYVQNTPQQMAQLQEAQQEALQIFTHGLLQGPTGFGQSGSTTPPNLLFPKVQPINFTPPSNNVPTPTFFNFTNAPTTTITSSSAAPPISPAFAQTPPIAPTPINELLNVTGDLALDSTSGLLASSGTNLSISTGAPNFVWSAGALLATQETALAGASTLSFSGSGPINYTYSAPDTAFDFLAQGETLTVTYNVTVTGGNGPSSQLVTIPITGSNDAPVITSTAPSQALTEDGGAQVSASGAISFIDVDLTDTHTASFAAQGTGYLGTFTLAPITQDSGNGGTGQLGWSFSVDNSAIDYLGVGESLVQRYNVTVDDGHGGTAVQTVTVTINGTNDAPVITSTAPSQAVTEDGGVQGSGGESGTESTSGTISFTDVDFTDTHTASFAAQGTGYLGTFSLAPITQDSGNGGTGQLGWSFSVDKSAIDYLATGENLVQRYNVTLDDGHGGTAVQTVTVTINGTNDAPVIDQGPQTASVTDSIPVAHGQFTATDVDRTDTQTWSIVGSSATHAPDYQFVIQDFQFTKNGAATPTFEDPFNDGTPPPEAENIGTGGVISGPNIYGTTGSFVEASGQVVLDGTNSDLAVLQVNASDPFYGNVARLKTNIDPSSEAGLKIDQSFAVTGTFDLAIPGEARNGYGIRLTDFANGNNNDIVALEVLTGPDGVAKIVLRQLDLQAHTATNISSLALAPSAQDNQIALTLSYTAPPGATLSTIGPQPVTASFQLLANNAGTEVADGSPVTLSGTGSIFTTENWTQAEFLAVAPAQSDSYLAGTYGILDLTQAGTWTYTLDNSNPNTRALAAGEVRQDSFQVQVADFAGRDRYADDYY